MRAFRLRGRFNRSQFAIASIAGVALFLGVLFGLLGLWFGASEGILRTPLLLLAMATLLAPATFVVLGSAIRRLHDIGHSDWHGVVFLLVAGLPILRVILPLYLLLTPGRPGAGSPSGRVAGALMRVLAILSAVAAPVAAVVGVPRLLESRIAANEAATFGDIRALLAWQEAYRSVNGGYYETRAECL